MPAGARTVSADATLHTDPLNFPPRRLVAAGHIALSAYYSIDQSWTSRSDQDDDSSRQGRQIVRRAWYLYDPNRGGYRKVSWAFLDVAPGLRQAAVLAGPLPSPRVGLLDMKTQRVTRWIELGHLAGAVSWSPDGRRLLLTTYDTDPDVGFFFTSGRTGYGIVDPGTGQMDFHTLAPNEKDANTRQDVIWSRDGALVRSPRAISNEFLPGSSGTPLLHETDNDYTELSPNRRYFALGPGRDAFGPSVQEVGTGQPVLTPPVSRFDAWADDDHLIARHCGSNCRNGRSRVVLIKINSSEIKLLTGYQNGDYPWKLLFTHR